MASRAELGKYPIIIDINKKILNYLSYLQGKDDNSIVKQSLQISIELYNNGQNSFYSNIMMSEYFDLFDFNYNSLSDSKIEQLVDLMEKKYVSYWNQTLQHSRKLSFYHSVKKNYSLSAYLDSTRKNPMRRTLMVATTYVLKQVGTTKFLSKKGYTVNDLINALSLMNASYLIKAPLS